MTNPSEPFRKKPSRAEKQKNRSNIPSAHPPKPIKKTPSRAEKKAAQTLAALPKRKTMGKMGRIITIAAITLVVAIVAVVAYYMIAIMPMQRAILTVGNENLSTGYFLKRVVASGNSDLNANIQQLEVELTVKQNAAANGVAPVTEQDIDTYLRNQAKGTNDTIGDADFNAWFDKQLANTGLSAKEYREVVGRVIQRQRLTDILSADISPIAPQIHLWRIAFSTNDAALAAKAKIDGGTDFAVVAADAGQTDKGDYGWTPLDVLPNDIKVAAAILEVGKCSDPVKYTESSSTSGSSTTVYMLLMVSETSDAMQMTDSQLNTLKSQRLFSWLGTQMQNEKIVFHGLHGSTTLDSETSAWLNLQVQKLLKKLPSAETTVPVTTTTITTTVTTTTESATTEPSTTTTNSVSP